MAAESFIQVTPDSSGKKVRNISADVLQPDGTTSTVYMQVTAIADENGRPFVEGNGMPVEDNETNNLLRQAVDLLQHMVLLLSE